MRNILDFLGFLLNVIVPICAALFGLVIGIVHIECGDYQQVTGRVTKVSAGNCYIQDGAEWYRWEEWKLRNATAGAK